MAYLRTRFVASIGTLCVGALVLVACAGKTLSLGTNKTQAQEVTPSEVTGNVTACAGGAAHPNVCCTAGPDQAGSCVVYPQAPFTQCDPGATTYPDPRSCCPLDGSGECSAPPAGGGGTVGSSGGGGSAGGACTYVCPPGWYAPAGSTETCCQTNSTGATSCAGGGGGPVGCGGTCDCPACPPDGGDCPPCNCTATPCPGNPTCDTCPAGWQTPQGQADLCCTTDANGDIECFSQATPPGQGGPTPVDAGTGPSTGVSCGGSASTDGAPTACECDAQTGGHTYAVSCDPGTNLCTCTVDNGGPSGSFPDNGNGCMDSTALFASCGFPVN